MPTVMKSEEVQAFAHCGATPGCPGVEQQPVKGLMQEIGHTFIERGGDLGSIENSFPYLAFSDESDRQCPHCGRDREISQQARVQYAASGYDPNYLLTAKAAQAKIEAVEEKDQEIAGLKAELAEQREAIKELIRLQMGEAEPES